MTIEERIKNSHSLTQVFGYWPSFHDAEVVEIVLDRHKSNSEYGPTVRTAIYVFEITPDIDEQGYYILAHHTLVWLRFLEVCELNIDDFNHQNVLWGLRITDISDSQLERVNFEVSFDPSFGVGANFKCYAVEVESVEPYNPEEI